MYHDVPHAILEQLKGEPVDFIVQSAHDYVKRTLGWIIAVLALFFSPFLLFPLIFSIPVFQLYMFGSTDITVNGVVQTYTRENPWGAIFFALFPVGILILVLAPFFFILRIALRFILRRGKWYAGTNQYLIEFTEDTADYYRWTEFEDTIKTTMRKGKMDIILTLKKSHSSESGKDMEDIKKLSNVNLKLNGKTFDLQNSHLFFMNKKGLLGLTNGSVILNMIRHNIERSNH